MNHQQLAITGDLAARLAEGEANDVVDVAADALRALPVGIHPSVPDDVYHARVLGIASHSGIEQILDSPAHFRAWIAGFRDSRTPALAIGRATDCAILEPRRFGVQYAIAPNVGDRRLKGPKAAYEQWAAIHRGKEILSADEGTVVLGMRDSVYAHPLARDLVANDNGTAQATLIWTHSTGVRVKCRLDKHDGDIRVALDVKTTSDRAIPKDFFRNVYAYGYHRQEALYRDGLAALGAPIDDFLFLVIEKQPPYACALFQLDEEIVAEGRKDNERAMATLSECLKSDRWPGYSPDIQRIERPAWARKKIA